MRCEEALEHPKPVAPELPVVLVAAAAIIDKNNRILLAKRPEDKAMAGLWEFPGGKVEKGELPEFALMRELEEELGIETRPCCFFPVAFASHSYDKFHLLMPLFTCRVWKGSIKAAEHDELAWVAVNDLYDYPMPEADIPLVATLSEIL